MVIWVPWSLEFHTGKGKNFRQIDVVERVRSIGKEKSKGLLGLHSFIWADWVESLLG